MALDQQKEIQWLAILILGGAEQGSESDFFRLLPSLEPQLVEQAQVAPILPAAAVLV